MYHTCPAASEIGNPFLPWVFYFIGNISLEHKKRSSVAENVIAAGADLGVVRAVRSNPLK